MSDVATPDVVVNLSDPAAHMHVWMSVGVAGNGTHTVVCDCGVIGSGTGEFADGTDDHKVKYDAAVAAQVEAEQTARAATVEAEIIRVRAELAALEAELSSTEPQDGGV